jgi:hypothetical protein
MVHDIARFDTRTSVIHQPAMSSITAARAPALGSRSPKHATSVAASSGRHMQTPWVG